MKVNFLIIDNYSIQSDDIFVDLHNCFDFMGFKKSEDQDEVILTWKKSKGNWVSPEELSEIIIIHRKANYFKVHEGISEYHYNSITLSEITYFPSEERETNDAFMLQELPEEGDDIIYFFHDDSRIRINCEEIEAITVQ